MLKKISNFFQNLKIEDITIDLSGGNTIIYQQGGSANPIKVNEPTVLVVDGESCISFGKDAEPIVGKCPNGVQVIYPIQKGIIAEPSYCEHLLKHYFKSLIKIKSLYCIYPNVLAVIPHGASASTQKGMTETIDCAGAKGIDLVTTLQAATRGIGKENAGASIIMNIAKDYTEIGIMSLNKTHYATTLQLGYDDFQKSIIDFIRGASDYTIGLNNAKKALESIGTAYYIPEEDEHESINILGLLKRTSIPADFSLTKQQVYTAINPMIDKLIAGLLEVLEKAKEDMADDLKDNGVSIIGIGGRISRLDTAIFKKLSINATIPKNFETCIAEGAGKIQSARDKK